MGFHLLFLFLSRPESGGPRRWRSRLPPAAHRLHQHAAAGAGERVPLQQVPVPAQESRDCRPVGSNRTAGESLVPKPADET